MPDTSFINEFLDTLKKYVQFLITIIPPGVLIALGAIITFLIVLGIYRATLP